MADPRVSGKPVALIPASNAVCDGRRRAEVNANYLEAARLAGCLPLVVPAAEPGELEDYLGLADGVLLTGAVANVHPSHFGEGVLDSSLPLDPERDALTLPLIRLALARGVPVFGICRGFQEMNVALGGSLCQAVHEMPGRMDHRARPGLPEPVHFAPAHPVSVVPGGLLERLTDGGCFIVNSSHGQGVGRLAEGLRVEALSPDGVVEAFTMPEAAAFNLGVQWHPEWRARDNPVSRRLFAAFGEACRARRAGRLSTR